MGEPVPEKRRGWSLKRKVGVAAAAYLALLVVSFPVGAVLDRLHEWWWRGLDGWPSGTAIHRVIDLLGHGIVNFTVGAYITLPFVSAVLVAVGLVLRRGAGPLQRVRRWVEDHPRGTRALTTAPAALWSLLMTAFLTEARTSSNAIPEYVGTGAATAIVGVVATILLSRVGGVALRALLAPTLVEAVPQRAEVTKDEIAFAAVAVTPETQAAVGGMGALSVVALGLVLTFHRATGDPRVVAGLVAYVTTTLAGAAIFRHASQVAIGVDGVLVKGTSRTRFFAYRDLDAANADGADLTLVRKDRVVLRLQLHGDDAAKRDAVLARIREAIARVKGGAGAVQAQMVSVASADELARAAGGAADYRGVALTRDQLWALVEGPEVDAGARRAAAEALAKASDGGDRARLRVAAGQCAAPEVRVAIERLAEAEDDDEASEKSSVGAQRRSGGALLQ
jgi:hypothetical protein